MTSRGLIRASLLLILLVLVGVGLWVGWQVWNVNRDLRAAVEDASALQGALEAGDEEASRAAVARLGERADSAADRTDSTTWAALTHIPWFGDDARGVRLVADVTSGLTVQGLRPLVEEATNLAAMLPKDGRVPIEALVDLQGPVAAAHAEFEEADRRLATEDPSGFIGSLESKYRELTRRVSDARGTLSTADTALQLMPDMLGRSGPRDYLLVFQNNAEVRSTGGLPGAVSVLHAEDGRLTLTRQVAASSFGATKEPVLPLTPAEERIYGPQLGTFFLDANFTPDFPRAAELMRARWEQVYDDDISGVFAIDPVALSYILGATGPVDVRGSRIGPENAVDELLHGVYLRYEDPAEQDRYFQEVARAVFAQVTSGTGDPQGLLRALSRAGNERRLLVHSFTPSEQEPLAGREIAGELPMQASATPQVGVYLNDATGAKMSYFLRTSVRVDSTSCAGGRQLLDGVARFRSLAPKDAGDTLPDYVTGAGAYGTEPGNQLVAVRLYAPVNGTVERIVLNGRELKDVSVVAHETRQVATVLISLKPQQTLDLSWRMTTGDNQTGDVVVSVTPTVEARNSSSVAASSC